MKQILLLLSMMLSLQMFSQRDTREILDAEQVRNIHIDTDEVFKIEVLSSKSPGIRIKTHSEGEYYDEIILETRIIDKTLMITTRYPQILSGGYDKLSAHKVFSLEIEIELPENLYLTVDSNIASLITHGKFRTVQVNLNQGYCQLFDFTGSAVVNTYYGNIMVETSIGKIEANSRNGNVNISELLPGRNSIKLNSVDGNILVRKN
ncbi:hypothetical protein [Christiangramia aquimixticola]|uniref:hypothetical protein n=1 Tax=Christiangramia aquimixticola TaxID=1697558 RepID=UPI003AA7FE00